MIPLYNPATDSTVNSGGIAGASYQDPALLLLNILIELRVMNDMAWDAQRGPVSQTVAQYRSDVLNDTLNRNI